MIQNEASASSQPVPPLFLIDDDDWMNIYASAAAMLEDLEWPYLDEVAHVFDSAGRAIRLSVAGESVRVDSVGPIAPLTEIQPPVSRFFEKWTYDDPPAVSSDRYLADVADRYGFAKFRRRKRR